MRHLKFVWYGRRLWHLARYTPAPQARDLRPFIVVTSGEVSKKWTAEHLQTAEYAADEAVYIFALDDPLKVTLQSYGLHRNWLLVTAEFPAYCVGIWQHG
jgi:hypothetical protein